MLFLCIGLMTNAFAQCPSSFSSYNNSRPSVESYNHCYLLETLNSLGETDTTAFEMTSASLFDNSFEHPFYVYDIKLGNFTGTLHLKAKGAAGGDATQITRNRDYFPQAPSVLTAKGGAGSLVSGYAKVGYKSGEIPPGSTLRYIIGEAGQSADQIRFPSPWGTASADC